jgi:hypothetical protein
LCRPRLRFLDVSDAFKLPPCANLSPEVAADTGAAGYRHMCQFMVHSWHRILSRYEYAVRVDEDVCVTRLPDIVGLMDGGAAYAYGLVTREAHEETVHTFLPWLLDYMGAQQPALRAAVQPLPSSDMYFTNFFVSRVAWWSSEAVQRFLRDVNASGGTYSHRWGGKTNRPARIAALSGTPCL